MSLTSGLLFAGILFVIGLVGVMIRRNVIFMLLSIEIMLNAAGVAFIFAGSSQADPEGQIMFLFILTVAAAEVAIGLALIIMIYQKFKTLDIDKLRFLKG
jgi:NADH-quinone oxidoreductase subunit K